MTTMTKSVVLDTPEQIQMFRLLTLRQGLKLELKGMRMSSKSRTAYSILKKEFGMKGSRQTVLDELDRIRDEIMGITPQPPATKGEVK